jgi:hypothetical protein
MLAMYRPRSPNQGRALDGGEDSEHDCEFKVACADTGDGAEDHGAVVQHRAALRQRFDRCMAAHPPSAMHSATQDQGDEDLGDKFGRDPI